MRYEHQFVTAQLEGDLVPWMKICSLAQRFGDNDLAFCPDPPIHTW